VCDPSGGAFRPTAAILWLITGERREVVSAAWSDGACGAPGEYRSGVSTTSYIEVWGAPDGASLASAVGAALGASPRPEYRDAFQLDGPGWAADVYPNVAPEHGEAPLTVLLWHERTGDDGALLHQLTDRVFDQLTHSTKWRLRASSDLEPQYLSRER